MLRAETLMLRSVARAQLEVQQAAAFVTTLKEKAAKLQYEWRVADSAEKQRKGLEESQSRAMAQAAKEAREARLAAKEQAAAKEKAEFTERVKVRRKSLGTIPELGDLTPRGGGLTARGGGGSTPRGGGNLTPRRKALSTSADAAELTAHGGGGATPVGSTGDAMSLPSLSVAAAST